jgi:N-acetylglucosaminyl-diphospho-decaprenol L-rhamnosyltransferase
MAQKRVTIVAMTHNSENRIARTLEKMRAAAPRTPLIIVDNGSVDRTREVVKEVRPDVTLVALPKNIGAAARNVGAKLARTPYVAFIDDDTWWEKRSLKYAADFLDRHAKVAVVNARILVGAHGRIDPVSLEMKDSPLPNDGRGLSRPILSFMAGAVMFRRSAFLAAGGYEERVFIGGEEEWLAWTLLANGWQLRYLPRTVVRHYPSLASFERIRPYSVRNTILLAWLRRPASVAARWTWHVLGQMPKNFDFLKTLWMIIRGVPWIITEHRRLPRRVEEQLSLLEASKQNSEARRYGS